MYNIKKKDLDCVVVESLYLSCISLPFLSRQPEKEGRDKVVYERRGEKDLSFTR